MVLKRQPILHIVNYSHKLNGSLYSREILFTEQSDNCEFFSLTIGCRRQIPGIVIRCKNLG